MARVECGLLEITDPRMDDARRTIRGVNLGECAVEDFIIKDSPDPLGNHYHKKKSELFYFFEGGGTIRIRAIDAEGNQTGPVTTFRMSPGKAILIPPFYTHRFDMESGTKFVCYSSRPYNKNADDTYRSPIAIES